MPMPPIQSSLTWLVVVVVPVTAAVLLPVELAVTSSGLTVSTPLYSMTTAAERSDDWVMVIPVPAPETLGAYQISVVEPLLLVAWAARDQVAPVCVMLLTLPALVPRVDITAIRVLPETGADVSVTLMVVEALEPVLAVLLCTRAAAAIVEIVCDPASLAARLALPVR